MHRFVSSVSLAGKLLICLVLFEPHLFAANHFLNNSELLNTITNSFNSTQIISALKLAYPQRIAETRFQNNDWSLRIDTQWFTWSDGRLLPQGTPVDADHFATYPFYNYPADIPDYRSLGKEEAQRIENVLEQRLYNKINRNPAFYDALWQADSKVAAWDNLEPILLFGKKVSIHRSISKSLAAIQEELYQVRQHDTALNIFLNRIDSVETWNWRTIKGTISRSYHSYGVALDLVIRSVSDAQLYWLWARSPKPGWYLTALRQRLVPPEAMIHIFEKHGFVWGGKWRMYDSMHFEYRPEIMILNKMPVTLD